MPTYSFDATVPELTPKGEPNGRHKETIKFSATDDDEARRYRNDFFRFGHVSSLFTRRTYYSSYVNSSLVRHVDDDSPPQFAAAAE